MTSLSKDSKVFSVPQVSALEVSREDTFRAMLSTLIHDTLEREFSEFLGAKRFERSPDRTDVRNGYRRRQFTTRVGRLELKIPRDRAGRFQPSLFARYERSEQALVLALAEMYVQGVSTRKVTQVVETLCGVSVSASEVSALVKRLDGELEVWRTRPLSAKAYPYLVASMRMSSECGVKDK